MIDTRETQIRVGQACNLAWQYAVLNGAETAEDAVGLAGDALPAILEWLNVTQAKHAFALEQTTPITAAPSFQPPPPPGAGAPPAPVPGVTQGSNSKKDQAWRDYFANPSDYYDNRVDKRNPKGPDFKHKQSGEGLWLGGTYPAPAWVAERLNMGPAF